MFFYTLSQLTNKLDMNTDVDTLQVLLKPETNKLYGRTTLGHTFKVQQNIDPTTPGLLKKLRFMSPTKDLTLTYNKEYDNTEIDGCLVLPKEGAGEVVFSF